MRRIRREISIIHTYVYGFLNAETVLDDRLCSTSTLEITMRENGAVMEDGCLILSYPIANYAE